MHGRVVVAELPSDVAAAVVQARPSVAARSVLVTAVCAFLAWIDGAAAGVALPAEDAAAVEHVHASVDAGPTILARVPQAVVDVLVAVLAVGRVKRSLGVAVELNGPVLEVGEVVALRDGLGLGRFSVAKGP